MQAADTDRDGRLTGKDAVAFFERSGLPKSELAKVWAYSDSARKGYLDPTTFNKVSAAVRTGHSSSDDGRADPAVVSIQRSSGHVPRWRQCTALS